MNERWSEQIPGRPSLRRPADGVCLIGVLDGEGIGPEVMGAARLVLSALESAGGGRFELRQGGLIGTAAEARDGAALSPGVIEFCRELFARGGALLHGPGGGRFVYDLRREFDLFCKISPVRGVPELARASRLKPEHVVETDFIIVRENSAGIYQGTWSETRSAEDGRAAGHSFSYSESEVRRILAVAAAISRKRRGQLTVVVKEGGVPTISQLWRDCAHEVAAEVGISVHMMNIDHAAYHLIQHARELDVVVTSNLFGDVLIDLSGVLLGSRALGFSGNFAPSAAVYQTNHGAAYDLAGLDRANPVGQLFALAMLLRESFGLDAAAERIEVAVRDVWRDGWRTADLAEPGTRPAGTREMGERVAEALLQPRV